jgi:hypothetical protein
MAIFSTPGQVRGPAVTTESRNFINYTNVDRTASNPLWQAAANPTPAPTPGPAAPPPPQTGPSAEDQYWDWRKQQELAQIQQQQNQLIEITKNYFRQNGMEAFIAAMEKYVRAGYDGDSIMVMIRNDPEYRAAWDKRFAGNAARTAKGLTELLPAQYIEMEQGYKQLFLRYGVPTTLFDTPDDFAALIGNDVSAVEVNDRLAMASNYVNYSGNEEVKRQLRDLYGLTDGEMMAYVLDPTRTQDYLASESRRNMNRANVGGAAVTQGVGITAAFRDEIAKAYDSMGTDASFADASNKFGNVAAESPLYARLGALSAVEATSDELIREQFTMAGGAGVANKKRGLASQERARFSGQSGLGSTSLSAGRRAQ